MTTKIELTKKVSETGYYSNTTDSARIYDVSARVTIGSGTPHLDDGAVRLKGGDAIVAAFTKGQYDSLRISYAGGEMPDTATIKGATTAICDFLDAINELSE